MTGARIAGSRLPIRLIAGTWCLAAFVFVQAYTSTLITYILAPTNDPLVSSFNELGERSDVQIILKKFGNVENMLTVKNPVCLNVYINGMLSFLFHFFIFE